jgi:hypothetical protein
MKKDVSKDTLIIIKSVEEDGFAGDGLTDYVPPLGTRNADAERTSETIVLDAMPAYGAFELILGKTTLEFKDEAEKNTSQDLQHPKDVVRGWDNLTGTLNIDNPRGSERFIGAVLGGWNPTNLFYYPWKDFRYFEIWVLKGVNRMDLLASSARTLIKHYYCTFDSGGEKFENPIKVSVPIQRRFTTRHPNWTAPAAVQSPKILTATALIAGQILDNVPPGEFVQPREHTRLMLTPTLHTGTHSVKVTGRNICGESIEETISIVDNTVKLGRQYFTVINTIESIDYVGTLAIDDHDYKIQ